MFLTQQNIHWEEPCKKLIKISLLCTCLVSLTVVGSVFHFFRSRVPPRLGAKTIEAKGIFPRAEVTRGHDWLWGDQDGKNSVVIIIIRQTGSPQQHWNIRQWCTQVLKGQDFIKHTILSPIKYSIARSIGDLYIWQFGPKPFIKKYWWNLNLAVAPQVCLWMSIAFCHLRYLNKAMNLRKKYNRHHASTELATCTAWVEGHRAGPRALLHALHHYTLCVKEYWQIFYLAVLTPTTKPPNSIPHQILR